MQSWRTPFLSFKAGLVECWKHRPRQPPGGDRDLGPALEPADARRAPTQPNGALRWSCPSGVRTAQPPPRDRPSAPVLLTERTNVDRWIDSAGMRLTAPLAPV